MTSDERTSLPSVQGREADTQATASEGRAYALRATLRVLACLLAACAIALAAQTLVAILSPDSPETHAYAYEYDADFQCYIADANDNVIAESGQIIDAVAGTTEMLNSTGVYIHIYDRAFELYGGTDPGGGYTTYGWTVRVNGQEPEATEETNTNGYIKEQTKVRTPSSPWEIYKLVIPSVVDGDQVLIRLHYTFSLVNPETGSTEDNALTDVTSDFGFIATAADNEAGGTEDQGGNTDDPGSGTVGGDDGDPQSDGTDETTDAKGTGDNPAEEDPGLNNGTEGGDASGEINQGGSNSSGNATGGGNADSDSANKDSDSAGQQGGSGGTSTGNSSRGSGTNAGSSSSGSGENAPNNSLAGIDFAIGSNGNDDNDSGTGSGSRMVSLTTDLSTPRDSSSTSSEVSQQQSQSQADQSQTDPVQAQSAATASTSSDNADVAENSDGNDMTGGDAAESVSPEAGALDSGSGGNTVTNSDLWGLGTVYELSGASSAASGGGSLAITIALIALPLIAACGLLVRWFTYRRGRRTHSRLLNSSMFRSLRSAAAAQTA